MSVSELPTMALFGLSAALVGLVAVGLSLVVSPERIVAGDASGGRPAPAIDAEAPTATQTATFATG
jgi:hypothetical protein